MVVTPVLSMHQFDKVELVQITKPEDSIFSYMSTGHHAELPTSRASFHVLDFGVQVIWASVLRKLTT